MTRPTRAQRRLTLRRRALLTAWLLAGGAIVARSAELQVVEGAAWMEQAVGQHSESMEVPAPRGAILDRNGTSLAVSHETFRVSIAPKELGDRGEAVEALVTNLKVSREKARSLTDPNRRWAVAPGRYPPAVRAALAELRGVYLDRQLDRVHPHQDLARGLLGNVMENEGRGGIEQQYEDVLQGRAGREIRARNSDGRLIPGKLIEVEPPLQGGELVLTIDRDLQEIGHEALKEAIEETGAKGGDLLVKTGEILAMVSIRDGSSSALTAINTPYEPGSTLKPFTVAAILEAGVGTLQDSVDTEDGRWTVAGRTITDVHAAGKITLSEALRESSNVGVAKIATRLSTAQQYENLRDFGFGVPSGIALPGEAGGTLRRPDRHRVRDLRHSPTDGHGLWRPGQRGIPDGTQARQGGARAFRRDLLEGGAPSGPQGGFRGDHPADRPSDGGGCGGRNRYGGQAQLLRRGRQEWHQPGLRAQWL